MHIHIHYNSYYSIMLYAIVEQVVAIYLTSVGMNAYVACEHRSISDSQMPLYQY